MKITKTAKRSIILFLLLSLSITTTFIGSNSAYAADTTAPASSLTSDPASPDGSNGWYVSPIDFTITADDLESGIKSINYKLDSDPFQTQTFNNTLNLIQNPSFEEAGNPVNLWDKTNDDPNSVFTQDIISAPNLGIKSARIDATTGTWNAYNNRTNFAVATPYENMTSSVWIKTQNVSQQAYYKVFVIYTAPNGSQQTQLITTSSTVTGMTDWQKISLNFAASHDAAIGVYMELGLKGNGTVWFDGATITSSLTSASVNFAVSSNGTHTLEYYGVDNAGNTETPHKTTSFKIDTKNPSRWTNFTINEQDNNHTFVVSINVTDNTSGLDTGSAEFQYSVDQGVTWGYYTNLLGCNSTFVQGWSSASTNPSTNGTHTTTLSTPAVDFCNSNWSSTKYIRFRIKDMAGNQGQSADFTINGSWIQITGGDIHSNNSISMQSSSTVTNLAGSAGGISNINSASNWFLEDYEQLPFDTYTTWYSKNPTTTALPSGKLPTTSGNYYVNSDFTIASTTIPNGLSSTQNLSAVIFVNGDLNINSNYSLYATSGIIFIVKGDITVSNSVSGVDGYYITDGLFDLGSGNTQITVSGGVQADILNIKRSLSGNQNSSSPAEIFTYKPKYLIVGRKQLTGNSQITWLGIK